MATADWRLGLPTLGWFVGYVALLWYFVPRMRDLARASSEARSLVMARVVDSYTNILTVKLFARLADEDAYVRDSIDEHGDAMRRHMRVLTRFFFLLTALNAALLVGTAAIGIWLWAHGAVGAGIVAAALPLAWQLSNVAGWVSWEVTGDLRERRRGAGRHAVDRGAAHGHRPSRRRVRWKSRAARSCSRTLSFGYGRKDVRPVLHKLNLQIKPGERVGLVGRSGVGKSTLVNLLLRFHAAERGKILIDGQDIAGVTQESLRAAIGMVTQDTSLLHRSIAANIRYGRPHASDDAGHRRGEKGAGARLHRRPARLEKPRRL